ncbi:cytochrome P450 2J2-like [Convolutriloba macropyga]|uniref:cytochrome P450 2J2-like n=1 Tax=Convolutriloba macropyga TaxID=536237 RepID=UPI003F522549
MDKLHKKYGPIMSLSLVGKGIWDIWFQGFDLMKEVLHDQRFSSRTTFSVFDKIGADRGVVFASGEAFKVKRRLTMQILRALGVGKSAFSTGIEDEANNLLVHLDEFIGKDIYIQGKIAYATNNIICKLLFNASHSFEDESFMDIHRKILRTFELFNPTQVLYLLPDFITQFLPKTHEIMRLRVEFIHYISDNFNKRKPAKNSTREDDECVSDYIWKMLDDKSLSFPETDIPYVLNDLFMAGQETITTTLSWLVLTMLHNPDIQDTIYEELMNEFPERDQIIPLNSILSCNYTMATMHETQRFSPVLFSSIDHTANVDIENFHGYKIPKGTRMFPQFALMNKDPNIWKYPNEFNPKNFLDENGVFQKSQYLMTFSIGLRSCPGENIAKMELYLVFANLMRRFKICPPENGWIAPLKPVIGFVISTPYYEVRLEKREK